jgi:hypothetical protein
LFSVSGFLSNSRHQHLLRFVFGLQRCIQATPVFRTFVESPTRPLFALWPIHSSVVVTVSRIIS